MVYIFGGAFDPPHVGHSAIIKSLLHYKHPDQIVIIPSSERDDKQYHVSDEHRLAMLDKFTTEIDDPRVIVDNYFIKNWKGEMITRDVDTYARSRYGEGIIHVFGADVVQYLYEWDDTHTAATQIDKIFIPRAGLHDIDPSEYGIERYELLSQSHIPDISSTELRDRIPQHASLKAWYEDDPRFIIPGLSRDISRYILEHRLYHLDQDPKPKILVHVCCGPDATMPILKLREEYDVVCFWYDPNIQPREEHDKRYHAFVQVCEIEGIPYIKGAYDVRHFLRRIRGLEHTPERGEKCTNCYDMRMYVAAKLAHKLKIPYYTSSLNTSPKKDLKKLFDMGYRYAERFGITFLDIPFRKRGGFEYSVAYTTEHDIYRQNYCGCIYSIREGGDSELKRRIVG